MSSILFISIIFIIFKLIIISTFKSLMKYAFYLIFLKPAFIFFIITIII